MRGPVNSPNVGSWRAGRRGWSSRRERDWKGKCDFFSTTTQCFKASGPPCLLYPNEGSCLPASSPSLLLPSPPSLYPGAWSSGLPLFPVSLGQLRPRTLTLCPHSRKEQSVSKGVICRS